MVRLLVLKTQIEPHASFRPQMLKNFLWKWKCVSETVYWGLTVLLVVLQINFPVEYGVY